MRAVAGQEEIESLLKLLEQRSQLLPADAMRVLVRRASTVHGARHAAYAGGYLPHGAMRGGPRACAHTAERAALGAGLPGVLGAPARAADARVSPGSSKCVAESQ